MWPGRRPKSNGARNHLRFRSPVPISDSEIGHSGETTVLQAPKSESELGARNRTAGTGGCSPALDFGQPDGAGADAPREIPACDQVRGRAGSATVGESDLEGFGGTGERVDPQKQLSSSTGTVSRGSPPRWIEPASASSMVRRRRLGHVNDGWRLPI